MTALQKPPKHKGHDPRRMGGERDTKEKPSSSNLCVRCVRLPRFVGVVFKDLFAVDSFIELLTNDGILVQIFTQYSVNQLPVCAYSAERAITGKM